MSLPYESATAGDRALAQLQKVLEAFGCQSFGTMTDQERQCVMVVFTWRGRRVQLEASWRGYAAAWLKQHPHTFRTRDSRPDYERKALAQARVSVCSVLRDWVKGQTTAVECGIMSFETAFMPHMLLPSGVRVIDQAQQMQLLPPADEPPKVVSIQKPGGA